MRTLPTGLATCALVFVQASAVLAQGRPQPGALRQAAAVERQITPGPTAPQDRSERAALAEEILRKRQDAMGRGAFDDRFVRDWTERLSQLSVDRLRDLLARAELPDLNAALEAAGASERRADEAIADLGDSGKDLVYTKVPPCRVADTRVVSNPLGNASFRDFFVAGATPGNFSAQGGAPCGIPIGATAVMFNLTVTGPTGIGWLRAYPYGGGGNASVINYKAGDTLANGIALPICDPAAATCTYDLRVVADAAGTHVIIDVMGYFMKPSNLGTLRTFTVDGTTPFGSPGLTLPESNACANFTSIAVTAPGAGEVLVTAKIMAHFVHTYGTANELWWGLSAAGGTDCTTFSTTFGGPSSFLLLDGSQATALSDSWDTVAWRFDVASAGAYTFYVNAKKVSGAAASARLTFGGMTATYHPR